MPSQKAQACSPCAFAGLGCGGPLGVVGGYFVCERHLWDIFRAALR